jgi:hypothetical protein
MESSVGLLAEAITSLMPSCVTPPQNTNPPQRPAEDPTENTSTSGFLSADQQHGGEGSLPDDILAMLRCSFKHEP